MITNTSFEIDTTPIDIEKCKEEAKQFQQEDLGLLASAKAFSSGGPGITLLLSLMETWMLQFFLSMIICTPIYYQVYQISSITSLFNSSMYMLDIFSYGIIQDSLQWYTSSLKLTPTDTSVDSQANGNSLFLMSNDIISFQEGKTDALQQWFSLLSHCTLATCVMSLVFLFWQIRSSEKTLDELDWEMVTPSDFSVEVRVRRGLCGCCNEYPLAKVGTGQLFAFADRNVWVKLFESPVNYWEEDSKDYLNSRFNEDQLNNHFLMNDQSPYDVKNVTMVKKTDNTLQRIKELNKYARSVAKSCIKTQNKSKKESNSNEIDQEAYDKVKKEMQELKKNQDARYKKVMRSMKTLESYENLDNMFAIVSFRNTDAREEFEDKLKEMNYCQQFNQQIMGCCAVFPKSLHQHLNESDWQRVEANRCPGEPDDQLWENIQVPPSEKITRYLIFLAFLLLLLSVSFAGQVWFKGNFIIVSSIVLFMNQVIILQVNLTIDYLRPYSKSVQISNQVFQIIISMQVNMAIIPLLIGYSTGYQQGNQSAQNSSSDIDSIWYEFTGNQIIMTQTLNILVPAIIAFLNMMFRLVYQSFQIQFEEIQTNDEWLDQYKGAVFEFEDNQSQSVCTIALSLTFAPNIPILIPVGFLSILSQQFINKYNLLYTCRKPNISEKSIQIGNNFLKVVLMISYLVAVATFSNDYFFCTDQAQCPDAPNLLSTSRFVAMSFSSSQPDVFTEMKTISVLSFDILILISLLTILLRDIMSKLFRYIFYWTPFLLLKQIYLLFYQIFYQVSLLFIELFGLISYCLCCGCLRETDKSKYQVTDINNEDSIKLDINTGLRTVGSTVFEEIEQSKNLIKGTLSQNIKQNEEQQKLIQIQDIMVQEGKTDEEDCCQCFC